MSRALISMNMDAFFANNFPFVVIVAVAVGGGDGCGVGGISTVYIVFYIIAQYDLSWLLLLLLFFTREHVFTFFLAYLVLILFHEMKPKL